LLGAPRILKFSALPFKILGAPKESDIFFVAPANLSFLLGAPRSIHFLKVCRRKFFQKIRRHASIFEKKLLCAERKGNPSGARRLRG